MGISMAIPTTEKNRPGPQRLKFSPWLPKLEPLPKRFFSRINSKTPNCSFHVLINRMKPNYSQLHGNTLKYVFIKLIKVANNVPFY